MHPKSDLFLHGTDFAYLLSPLKYVVFGIADITQLWILIAFCELLQPNMRNKQGTRTAPEVGRSAELIKS